MLLDEVIFSIKYSTTPWPMKKKSRKTKILDKPKIVACRSYKTDYLDVLIFCTSNAKVILCGTIKK